MYSHIKYKWWPEIDEERRKEVELNKIRAKAREESFLRTMARATAQEQSSRSSSGSLYGSPGCGEAHIDTTDY